MIHRILAVTMLAAGALPGQPLRFGTLAGEGTEWYTILEQTRQEWRRISSGKATMQIYGNGVQGDEPEMLRRVRVGHLQGVMLSNAGLPQVDRSTRCLSIPLLFDGYDDYDYVHERIAPKLEERIRASGFTVLAWGDVGWVHFFTKKPASTLAQIRGMTMFTGADDPEAERLYVDFGFRVRPLAYTDLLVSLKSGMVEAFNVPPLFALANQSFGAAKNMTSVRWAPLPGATLICAKAWDDLPSDWRAPMKKAAQTAALRQRSQIRKLGDDSIVQMRKYGLNVVAVSSAEEAAWRKEVEAAWPKLRGRYCEAALFDEILALRNEYRAKSKMPVRR